MFVFFSSLFQNQRDKELVAASNEVSFEVTEASSEATEASFEANEKSLRQLKLHPRQINVIRGN
jgi:hypothetical protein